MKSALPDLPPDAQARLRESNKTAEEIRSVYHKRALLAFGKGPTPARFVQAELDKGDAMADEWAFHQHAAEYFLLVRPENAKDLRAMLEGIRTRYCRDVHSGLATQIGINRTVDAWMDAARKGTTPRIPEGITESCAARLKA